MIIDSHFHLIRKKNFDTETCVRLGFKMPEDTPLDKLIGWMKDAGIKKAVAMGQDMSRIWNTTFGEEYLLESVRKYPDFLTGLASAEPLDKANRLNRQALDYVEKALTEYNLKGVLFTPPYGQYYSNDKTIYPFYELIESKQAVCQYHHSAQIGPAISAPTKYANMFLLNDVIIDFPNMKIVVEHIGYPWSEHLFILMANDENVYTDLAMMYDRPMKTVWSLVLAKEYGVIDRVMFATDYVCFNYDVFSSNPTDDYKRWITFVENGINEICIKSGWPTFSDDEIEGILWRNANRLYQLT